MVGVAKIPKGELNRKTNITWHQSTSEIGQNGQNDLWDTNYTILMSNIYNFLNITWNGIIPGSVKSA